MKKFFKWLSSDPKLDRRLQCRYNEGYAKGWEKGKLSTVDLRVRVTTLEARMERLDKLMFELRTRGHDQDDRP
jgi:hypothetical protein